MNTAFPKPADTVFDQEAQGSAENNTTKLVRYNDMT